MVQAGEAILNRAGIPTFQFPDTAARAFHYMWRYTYHLRGIYETPSIDSAAIADREGAERVLAQAKRDGLTLLDEVASKRLLTSYGIPTNRTVIAMEPDQAVREADLLGYPVVVKLFSRTITHKTDVGGVKLNLADALSVRKAFAEIRDSVTSTVGAEHFIGVTIQPMVRLKDAYELIVGSSVDPQFGPVLLFGAGGQLVEVFKDRALGLPPLNATLARRMMEQTKVLTALKGVRGRRPVDLPALEQLLVRFALLVAEQPRIREIDINPLLASPDGLMAVDARVVLHDFSMPDGSLPRPAIRPYPAQYVQPWTMKDGSPVTIRPIRPEDEPLVVEFHRTLSERSVQLRYFHAMKLSTRVAHDRLVRVCFNDYDREIALVADYGNPKSGMRQILGIARLSKQPGGREAEFAMVISDQWQNRGLGRELLARIVKIARDEGLQRVTADVLRENLEMQRVAEKVGFTLKMSADQTTVHARLDL